MKHVQITFTEAQTNAASPVGRSDSPFGQSVVRLPNGQYDLSGLLSGVFLSLGLPANVKGYAYLMEAVCLVVESPRMINALTKQLYPAIALRFDTQSACVERAIRHAIDICWRHGRVETLNELLGCRMVSQQDKPSSGELIGMIAARICPMIAARQA